jgi:hypothetical protein
MQDVEGESVTGLRYCYAICVEWLPDEVLRADGELCRLVKSGGKCFARILRRASQNTLWVCVAADPRHLGDEKWSHLVEVSASALPVDVGVDILRAAAIPAVLLDEDAGLRHTAEEQGECPALIECQINWDLYRVRIAPSISRLDDKNQSHVIYLSQVEVQDYMGYPPEEVKLAEVSDASASACLPFTPGEKTIRLKQLVSVPVSQEELIAVAEEVGILPLSAAALPRRGSPSWLCLSQLLEALLYRTLIYAVSHRRALLRRLSRAFLMGKRLGKWLIKIRATPIEDRPGYWCLRVHIPSSLMHVS